MRTRCATWSSMDTTRPPSPIANRFFVGKKLKVEQTPVVAIPGAPNACAASSIERKAERCELLERSRAAEQVHRHDRLRPRRDPRGDVVGIEVERDRVDVGEHRRRADARDRLRRGEEREGRADHLVAGADPHRLEGEHERIGAVRDADRVLDAEIGGRLLLKSVDLRPEDEAPRLEHFGEALLQLGDERRVLRLDVDERDHSDEHSDGSGSRTCAPAVTASTPATRTPATTPSATT